MAKSTRYDELKHEAKVRGFGVSRWAPGDGVTRYRFHDKGQKADYFENNGVCTALGQQAAYRFLHTGTCPRGKVSVRGRGTGRRKRRPFDSIFGRSKRKRGRR